MNKFSATALAFCLSASAGLAMADDAMKADGMSQDSTAKAHALQECRDRMAASGNDGMKKDASAMRMDAMCTDMIKREDLSRRSEAIPTPDMLGHSAMKK